MSKKTKSITKEIEQWLQDLANALISGKVTKEIYDELLKKINSLKSDVAELEEGEGIISDAELVAEITVDAAEVGVEVAAALA